MSVIGTVKEFITDKNAETPSRKAQSKGAYWCDDCSVRIPDVDADGDDPPTCPECGDGMRFERSDPGHCGC